MLKTNSFPGKRSDTPDSNASAQRTVSPVQNTGPGSPNSSMVATNHHPIPHLQHHQNHRPYFPRGRYRGDGGYYGGHNHFGGHHPNLNRRTSPPIHGPPFSKDLVDFMMKEWEQFSTNYRSTHPGDPIDNGLVMHPGHHQHQQHQPIVPTSPRVGGHVNSPHRGQHIRYNHQNSPGNNWSINNGGNGRKYSENGDHSNTGSLRRHHNHRGGHAPSPLLQGNQPWQRSTLTNRQNSPNNTLNRPTGFSMPHYLPLQPRRRPRHTYPSRPIVSPTSPAAASVTSAATSPVAEASSKVAETAAVPVAEMHSLSLKSADTSKPTSAAAPVANGKNNAEGLTEPSSAAPAALLDVEAKKRTTSTTTMSRDEAASSTSSSSTSSLTISKVTQQQQQTSGAQQQRQHHHHSTRRRAATTQGGSSVSASTTAAALPLSSSLPATRASETASVASSSFCSLVDQVDAMSAADQYFTPEPPSPSSSASASLSVGVLETSHHFTTLAAVKSASTESPPLSSPPPLAPAPVSSSAVAATATTTNR
ncbi:hypothetical transcript [Echinococcus multilocularis]|uniref:Hypothetical transcript n=1 Tax=Echinococcus multilocularis TaxID=6211 RepID=A0A087VY12_ECHMU|nr:hypothetical transcript [Echinococcus multilocularis]